MDSDQITFLQGLIGQPWDKHERHCWWLVEEVEKRLFDREVPVGPVACPNRMKRFELLSQPAEHFGWMEIDRPEHGAVVRMFHVGGNPAKLEHAGVYLVLWTGGFLHTDQPHGCVFDTMPELTARGWMPRFFVPLKGN